MRKITIFILCLCVHLAVSAQGVDVTYKRAASLKYWFDGETTDAKTCSSITGTQTIDVSALADGMHAIHFQIIDDSGTTTPAKTSAFLKLQTSIATHTASKMQYWFDSSESMKTISHTSGTQTIDVSSLKNGIHTVHYQLIDNDGNALNAKSGAFLILNSITIPNVTVTGYQYWIDNSEKMNKGTVGVNTIDVSSLAEGIHTIHYQPITSDGSASSAKAGAFLVLKSTFNTVGAKSLQYWFDNKAESKTIVSVTGDVQSVNVSSLDGGIHTIHYQVIDADGNATPSKASSFYVDKIGDGTYSPHIEFVINGKDTGRKDVVLDDATSTIELDVPAQAVTSDNYILEKDGAKAVVNTNNEIIVKYYDLFGTVVSETAQYIDERNGYILSSSNTTSLPSGNEKKVATPKEKEIIWYEFNVGANIEVSLRLNTEAVMEVYDPSGECILDLSGAQSLNTDKFKTVSGTYDVAIHTVKDTKAQNIQLQLLIPTPTGINNINANGEPFEIYDLSGRRVNENAHGVVIKNGKKYLRK